MSILTALVLSMLFVGVPRDVGETIVRYAAAPTPRIVRQDISFQEKSAAHGTADDGCELSSTTWESSDGAGVFLKIKHCKSQANADKVFRQLANSATRIFERSVLTGKGGRKTGQRIVVAFSDRGPIFRREAIVWTKGDEVYIVESASFEHALLFEKKWRTGLI